MIAADEAIRTARELVGTQLVVLEEKDGWLRVEYRGYTGWVSAAYCCNAGED